MSSWGGQDLPLINILAPQTKWGTKCLCMKIKPLLFTAQQEVFDSDGVNVTKTKDRRSTRGRLDCDGVFLNSIATEAGLVDMYIKFCLYNVELTFQRGNSQSRRVFFKWDLHRLIAGASDVGLFPNHVILYGTL